MEEIYYPKEWISSAKNSSPQLGTTVCKKWKGLRKYEKWKHEILQVKDTIRKGKQEEAWIQLEANRESNKKLKDNQYANNSMTI